MFGWRKSRIPRTPAPAAISDLPDCALRPEWLDETKHFAHPRWEEIRTWIEGFAPARHNDLWCAVARNWARCIAAQFSDDCQVYESANFFGVFPGDLDRGKRTMAHYEQLLQTLRRTLGAMALGEWFGKFTVFIAPNQDTFFRYLSDYHRDGVHMQPGGVFINRGYGHILLPSAWHQADSEVIAHELCHALLLHRPLPLWLNEAVTMAAQAAVAGLTIGTDKEKTLHDHRKYWTAERIADFWRGTSFDSPGDRGELSYDLARLLLRGYLAIDRKKIIETVVCAHYQDAGFSAFREVYGVSPDEGLTALLGPGDWANGHVYAEPEGAAPA